MRFRERKEFGYDPDVFSRQDTVTALKIHAEWTRAHAPRPYPVFMEVDRSDQKFDPLWHVPIGPRTLFSREISMPCLVTFDKALFRRMKFQIQPKQADYFMLSHNILESADYFPLHGDIVYFNGYRYSIVDITVDPAGYWQQTNLWTGLYVTAIIPPDGDARPVSNPGTCVPAEVSPARSSGPRFGSSSVPHLAE